jgi:hypothetical protein
MRILLDFKCTKCGLTEERFIDSSLTEDKCSCGGVSKRIISMPTVKLDGTNPDFPGAYEKWANDRVRRAEKHHRKNRED